MLSYFIIVKAVCSLNAQRVKQVQLVEAEQRRSRRSERRA